MPQAQPEKRRVPTVAWVRLLAFVALILMGFVLVRITPMGDLLTEERIAALIDTIRETWWAPILLIGLFALVSVVGLPPVPLLVGGAAFGALYGSLYNTLGLMLGAALAYGIARLLGRDFVVRVTGQRIRRAELVFERHGFWPLVQTRFLPLPFAAVNFGAALAGVEPARFLVASTVGLVPSTLIHTVFIASAIETRGTDRAVTLAGYAAAFLLFNVLISTLWVGKQAQRRRRYRELVALRARRRTDAGSGRETDRNHGAG
jgi:uncharacterized membrane protein YdjX (TVP38/TMEM64 family)